MLARSDVSIVEATKRFTELDVEVAFLVPTENGYRKSIMDAIAPVREYLKDTRIHDYGLQGQGQENRVYIAAYFVKVDSVNQTVASLYRPTTKSGDPRIWFKGLKDYCAPHNLLALLACDDAIYVINCSNPEILDSARNAHSALGRLVARVTQTGVQERDELMNMLHEIADRGFIKSVTPGPTGIGATLEHHLGIARNARKTPDYKGIEIKSTRVIKSRKAGLVTLFAQVPDWRVSPCKSGYDILQRYGYRAKDGLRRLTCTVTASKPNSQNLILQVDDELEWLLNLAIQESGPEEVARWAISVLQDRLAEKHPRTFWVKATSNRRKDGEYFRYYEVHYTKQPKVASLPYLLQDGVVTLDYTLKLKANGRTRDHGYLFRIFPVSFDALFPPVEVHRLGR